MVESGFLGFLDFVRSDFYISAPHPPHPPDQYNFSRTKFSKFLTVESDPEPGQTRAAVLVAMIMGFSLLAHVPLL